MSDDQSAPVEPEGFTRPSDNVEPGLEPGADDTVAETNAAFAMPAGQSAAETGESTDTDASATQADERTDQRADLRADERTHEHADENAPAHTRQDGARQDEVAQAAAPGFEPVAQPTTGSVESAESVGSALDSTTQGGTQPQVAPWPQPAAQQGWPSAEPNFAPGTAPVVGFEYGVTSISTQGGFGALGAEPKPRNKALLGTGIGLGYAALAAVAAFAVIAIASPGPVKVAGLAGASAPVTESSSPAASPSPAPTSAAPSTAPPTTATPTSTVTGHVSNGVHTGDLRFFLLPPPDGSSSVQGDPDGTTESLSEVVNDYGGSSDVKTSLRELGFKSACDRTYQDSSIGANVDIQLIRLGGSSDASAWLSGYTESGSGIKSISVPGESGAKGWSWKSDNSYEVSGAYRDGDTFFTVDIYGDQPITAADLASVIKAEHARLANG
ncbi:hypothetical protein KDL01_15020 [Actinospica durhamensis]|uniref:Uncharacterized protein n=1 Tax=Actinospica durhamensis TaxID=1508375 RepID=A0A941IP10_9ACTN|nr:hypothetical protein [Actinospica durhamensis]MBR7834584.1 hypothetical protein [Actinospica durhamensis]